MTGQGGMRSRRMNNNVLEICREDGQVILSLSEIIEGETLTMFLSGQITNDTAHEFEDEVMAALTVCRRIVLDFAGVTYIASMAMRSLLSAQQIVDEMEDSSIVLTKIQPPVMEILEESGFTDILTIEKD